MKINNPKFHNAQRLGKSTRFLQSIIDVPTMESLPLKARSSTTIKLYDNQQDVYDVAKDITSALIEGKTGIGKTVMAIALFQAWTGRTLIVCHSLQLAQQFADEFQSFIKIKPSFFCGGKHDKSGDIVITTHTTFRKAPDTFTNIANIIIDECDLFVTDKSLKAISQHPATRKFGLTGTPKTPYDSCNDGLYLEKLYGRHIIAREDESKNVLKTVTFHQYTKKYKNHPHNWIEFRKELDEDIERKVAMIAYILDNSDSALLLFDRVSDAVSFQKALLKRNKLAYLSTGEMSKENREEDLQLFKKNGGYLCAVATTVGRGYSNTMLDKAFILFPLKGENTLRQNFGRVLRFFEGKESHMYLWSDSMLAFQKKEQMKIIKEHYAGVTVFN